MAGFKTKPGDIFSIPVSGDSYVFGRVLLDVKNQCIKPKLVDPMSRFSTYVSSVLVEVYRELSKTPVLTLADVLIPGVFVGLPCVQ